MFAIKLLLIFILAIFSYSHAYLDPNAGSGVVAFFVAIFAGIAFYFKKILYFFKNLFKKNSHVYVF